MKEIELKVLEIDPVAIEETLIGAGFKKLGSSKILEKMFDSKNKVLKKNKKLLRLRSIFDKVELTFKERVEKHPFLKLREEKQVVVDSFAVTEEILENLGFFCMAVREKKRTSFTREKVRVDVDEYPGAKPYLEIEGSEGDVLETLKILNYPLEKTSKLSSTKILKLYNLNTKELFF